MSSYESHSFLKPDFPLILHCHEISPARNHFIPHWHDNVELLCFLSGSCVVLADSEQITATAGDLVIINSNQMHAAYPINDVCKYYCFIIGRSFLESLGLPMNKLVFDTKLLSREYLPLFHQLWNERSQDMPYYQALCKGLASQLMGTLAREHSHLGCPPSPSRMGRIKNGLIYLKENYQSPITVEQVCDAAGLSKYYFCRLFREYTGMSVIQYVNRLRCEEARRLLATGQFSVARSAEMAGFNNLSYFTRTYVKQMGCLPSKDN